MSLQHNAPVQHPAPTQPRHLIGGAVVDAQGRETAITENMIQQACQDLDRQWRDARKGPGARPQRA
ncbi:PA1571 family protein [Pseudomonas sp. LRF_L74]|uniref:PA1571 family protein n=1 Tax=Pseudomonas sp. LRF_L74 TaxID=3369422 RepID=UPI003F63C178